MAQKGIVAVIFDNNGSHYFLILHSKTGGWLMPKSLIVNGESPEGSVQRIVQQSTGLSSMKVQKRLDEGFQIHHNDTDYDLDIYLVEASMNSPVTLTNLDYDTYLWGTLDRIREKLVGPERDVFEKALGQFLPSSG